MAFNQYHSIAIPHYTTTLTHTITLIRTCALFQNEHDTVFALVKTIAKTRWLSLKPSIARQSANIDGASCATALSGFVSTYPCNVSPMRSKAILSCSGLRQTHMRRKA